MVNSTRRLFVANTTLGVGVLAGCTNTNNEDETRLNELHLVNKYRDSQEIYMEIIFEDDEIYNEIHTLPPADDGIAGSEKIESVWPDETGEIVLKANLKETDRSEEFKLSDVGSGDFDVHFIIEEGGGIHFSYSID